MKEGVLKKCEHGDKAALFCQTCVQRLCDNCKKTHPGHDVIPFQKAWEKEKENSRKILRMGCEELTKCVCQMNSLKEMLEEKINCFHFLRVARQGFTNLGKNTRTMKQVSQHFLMK